MDVKIAFLILSAVALFYTIEVDKYNADNFSTVVCQKFPVKQKKLYHFVTFPEMVGKWLNVVTYFASTDSKPIGIGKFYRIEIYNLIMHFKITKFVDGNYIAMESNFVLLPYIEIMFFESESDHNAINNNNNNNQNIPHNIIKDIFKNCTSNKNVKENVSKLIIRLSFRRYSLLFQYTFGKIFQKIFEYQLKASLSNLNEILMEFKT